MVISLVLGKGQLQENWTGEQLKCDPKRQTATFVVCVFGLADIARARAVATTVPSSEVAILAIVVTATVPVGCGCV